MGFFKPTIIDSDGNEVHKITTKKPNKYYFKSIFNSVKPILLILGEVLLESIPTLRISIKLLTQIKNGFKRGFR
jgi:hypothetical protein